MRLASATVGRDSKSLMVRLGIDNVFCFGGVGLWSKEGFLVVYDFLVVILAQVDGPHWSQPTNWLGQCLTLIFGELPKRFKAMALVSRLSTNLAFVILLI